MTAQTKELPQRLADVLKNRVPAPRLDKVVIVPFSAEDRTEGGIIIPDDAQEKPVCGAVVSVGPGALFDDGSRGAMEYKVGDIVLYSKYSGTTVLVDKVEYIIMRQDEVTCALEKK